MSIQHEPTLLDVMMFQTAFGPYKSIASIMEQIRRELSEKKVIFYKSRTSGALKSDWQGGCVWDYWYYPDDSKRYIGWGIMYPGETKWTGHWAKKHTAPYSFVVLGSDSLQLPENLILESTHQTGWEAYRGTRSEVVKTSGLHVFFEDEASFSEKFKEWVVCAVDEARKLLDPYTESMET